MSIATIGTRGCGSRKRSTGHITRGHFHAGCQAARRAILPPCCAWITADIADRWWWWWQFSWCYQIGNIYRLFVVRKSGCPSRIALYLVCVTKASANTSVGLASQHGIAYEQLRNDTHARNVDDIVSNSSTIVDIQWRWSCAFRFSFQWRHSSDIILAIRSHAST